MLTEGPYLVLSFGVILHYYYFIPMKKSLYVILFLFALVSCNHESKSDRIYRHAREFTQNSCPKQMDEFTVLDSLVYEPETRVMSYYYSVSGRLDTDSVYNSKLIGVFHTNLLDNIRQNVGLLELKEHATTFRYTYYSSVNAKEYMSFIFTPEDYK